MNDTVALLIAWMRPRRVAMDTRGHVHFTCIISLLTQTALHDGRDHALQTELYVIIIITPQFSAARKQKATL